MKTMKKVLGVLLALTMLVGLLAVAPAAAGEYDDSYAVNLWLSADKDSYAAGDTVVLTISEQVNPAIDQRIDGQYPICYPDGKIQPINLSGDGSNLADVNFTALVAGYDASMSGYVYNADNVGMGYTNDPGYATMKYNVAGDGTTFGGSTKTDIFTVEFKVADDCPDGDYQMYFSSVGFNDLWDGYCGDIYTEDYNYGSSGSFKFHPVTIHVGAPSVADPAYLKTQCQWADGNTAGNLNVGISATFSTDNYPIAFNEAGHSTNVTAVGVDVTAGDYTTTQETQFVYEVDATTYRYRAVITGVPHDASGELTVQFYIVINGEKKLGEIKTINLGDVIAASTAAGLPAYTGA